MIDPLAQRIEDALCAEDERGRLTDALIARHAKTATEAVRQLLREQLTVVFNGRVFYALPEQGEQENGR